MRLTKHHGWGNDFLVLLDAERRQLVDAETARRVCDRHAGIGADGLIRATPSENATVDAVMHLYNADGTRAEMSGNGIRCLVQALLLAGWVSPPQVVVDTDAGIRRVDVLGGATRGADGTTTHLLSVDMGGVQIGADAAEWALGPAGRATWVDAGNPHVVVEVTPSSALPAVNLAELGQKVNAITPNGANVHVMAIGADPGAISVRTYERGVGLTEACGTGACASAVVASSWGLVGDNAVSHPDHHPMGGTVVVHMPGGRAEVVLGERIRLIGPAIAVAAVDYPWP